MLAVDVQDVQGEAVELQGQGIATLTVNDVNEAPTLDSNLQFWYSEGTSVGTTLIELDEPLTCVARLERGRFFAAKLVRSFAMRLGASVPSSCAIFYS